MRIHERITCLSIALFFCFITALSLPVTALALALAREPEHKVVRVGWFESPFNYSDRFGRRTGYAYEYQQKIAAYTGWDYEFVEGSFPDLMEKLVKGEIDLMSDVSYTEERGEMMLFSSLPMGAEAYYAFVAADATEYKQGDARAFEGKRVGINKGSYQEMLFREWERKNGVHAQVVELTGTHEESIAMLSRGEIDSFVTIDAYGDTDVYTPVFKVGQSEFFPGP